jgi:indolepyruvate ferredoxin oxidoreductase alpha subunit
VLLVVLDNGTTAMTGHQLNPGVDAKVLGDACVHLDIESIVRGCGVTEVAKVKPFNLKATMKTFEEMKGKTGVRVIIAEEPCILYARRTLKLNRPQAAYVAEQGAETDRVLNEYACPAFYRDETGVQVDESLCTGCMVCMQISKNFKARKRSA